ncbi:MAG: hypothetical protein ACHQJ7_10455 [Vicinamibacteria bacterium]|jgi:hypothetical protein
MRSLPSLAFVALLALLSAPVAAKPSTECGPPPDGAICADGSWPEFSSMTVYAVQGESRARYEIIIGDGRDIKVAISENNPHYQGRADALLIDGSVLATRGGETLPNRGQDLLSDPLLAAQEVATLLQVALPKGPKSIAASTKVSASGTRFVVATTPTASTYYAPPWKVEGTIAPAGKESLSYDLTFTARVGAPDGSITPRVIVYSYSGRASYPARRPRIPDGTSLVGWKFDLPNAQNVGFATLGQARRALGIEPR